jgi:hypothetical protein
VNDDNHDSDDDNDDSDDDLMRMMMGGGGGLYDSDDSIADNGNKVDDAGTFTYDDNDDEHQYYVDDTNLVEEEEGEDVAILLKRALSVHAALLLSLPSSLSSALRMADSTNNDDHVVGILLDGRKLVEELVVAILSTGHEVEGSKIMGSDNNTEKSELVDVLSFFINFSNIYRDANNSKNKYQGTTLNRGGSSSCWNVEKVRLTSSLFAIQFLLCLNDITILRKQDQTILSSNRSKSDHGWGGTMSKIILPLFFGTMTSKTTHNIRTTSFLSNDALRNAVLDLISFSLGEDGVGKGQAVTSTCTTTAASAVNNATAAAVNLCLDIMHHAISSTSATSFSFSPPLLRQKIIVVSSFQIFIRIHDGIHKSNNNKSGGDTASIIHDTMHRTVVMILRQIGVDCRRCHTLDDSKLSPESLLRPITGLLLPKRYGCHQQHQHQQQITQDRHSNNKQPQSVQTNAGDDEENVNMNEKAGAELLWNEILLLLKEEHNNDGRHRHDNWYVYRIHSFILTLHFSYTIAKQMHVCLNFIRNVRAGYR